MANYKNIVPTLKQLKKQFQKYIYAISVLETQINEQVTASTDSNADYAAELVDARVDSTGTAHSSAGANVRYWQGSLEDKNEFLQDEIDDLAEAYIGILTQIGNIQSRLRALEN